MISRFRKQWAIPSVLAVLTAVGLTSALVGDGPWDALSWLLLATPVMAAIWCVVPRSGSNR